MLQARIAGLAGGSLSNPQIAAELFIRPRTVEFHLSKVYKKLGVEARGQLADALSADGRSA